MRESEKYLEANMIQDCEPHGQTQVCLSGAREYARIYSEEQMEAKIKELQELLSTSRLPPKYSIGIHKAIETLKK